MICPKCKGEGVLRIFSPQRFMNCYFCNGSKTVPEIHAQWIVEGTILKDRRIQKRFILRKAANLLKMDPKDLSDMEIGKVKPNLNISYRTIKTIKH